MSDENIFNDVVSMKNLISAWHEARKGKTGKQDVIEFEKDIAFNLKILYDELKNQAYRPKPLETFILRDPKTRKISKSDFRDRVVHHALIRIIGPVFDKAFIYDSCANRKGKGTLFALKRFDKFKNKVSKNGTRPAYCLKADIRHYFNEVDHGILLKIIKRKIRDERVLRLIEVILENNARGNPLGKGMPLGNLTSQFFANVYLHELDRFSKHELKAKFI